MVALVDKWDGALVELCVKGASLLRVKSGLCWTSASHWDRRSSVRWLSSFLRRSEMPRMCWTLMGGPGLPLEQALVRALGLQAAGLGEAIVHYFNQSCSFAAL